MHITVYSVQEVLHEGEVKSVSAKTTEGEVTILDHHRPYLAELDKGTLLLIGENGFEKRIEVLAGGFIEVTSKNTVRVLVGD